MTKQSSHHSVKTGLLHSRYALLATTVLVPYTNQEEDIMTQPLWSPNPQEAERTYMAEFIRYVNKRFKKSLYDYHHLYQWSIENPDLFWHCVWDFCGVVYK